MLHCFDQLRNLDIASYLPTDSPEEPYFLLPEEYLKMIYLNIVAESLISQKFPSAIPPLLPVVVLVIDVGCALYS